MLQMNKDCLTSGYLTGSLKLTIPLRVSSVKIEFLSNEKKCEKYIVKNMPNGRNFLKL